MIRMLVTGGQGMLGRAFAEQGAIFPDTRIEAPGRAELDVRDGDALLAAAARLDGGWLVHCAAKVDVEGCARDPDTARAIMHEMTTLFDPLAASGFIPLRNRTVIAPMSRSFADERHCAPMPCAPITKSVPSAVPTLS